MTASSVATFALLVGAAAAPAADVNPFTGLPEPSTVPVVVTAPVPPAPPAPAATRSKPTRAVVAARPKTTAGTEARTVENKPRTIRLMSVVRGAHETAALFDVEGRLLRVSEREQLRVLDSTEVELDGILHRLARPSLTRFVAADASLSARTPERGQAAPCYPRRLP